MNTKTVTAVFPAPSERVFAYLSDVENLPRWATEFARELKVVGPRYKIVNGLGELFFELRADSQSGVIDVLAGPDEGSMALFPSRVVELPGGDTAYTLTMFQAPDQPDELFEAQYQSLLREFDNIRRELAE